MSALHDALRQYIAVRRALGTQYKEPARTLGYFVDFLEREGADFITTELAVRWATEPALVQSATWDRRLTMVRGFAEWLSVTDARTMIPPLRILGARRQRKRPHIFTQQEVKQLMAEATQLPSPRGLRALTYETLIGLLATTGLRPGEALSLDKPDVDLYGGILTIRETKFGKSRFVPVDETTRAALACYAQRRDTLCLRCQTAAFLISENGLRLQGCSVRRTFAKISRAIGLRPAIGGRRLGRGPRLQDFRHSFATLRLLEWYRAGLDVQRELPKLTTYLGHSDVAHTYWYIEALPELLLLATDRATMHSQSGGER